MTPKQESFCLAYIETGNASEAYRRAYDAGRMSEKVTHNKASDLLKRGDFGVRVEAFQAEHRERHNVTVDSLTADLVADRLLARNNKQASAAITATMGMAKLHGLMVDKKELTGKDGGPIAIDDASERVKRLQDMTDDEVDARIEELTEKKNAA
jgi:phage terminase small subunit